jgi:hypothetical protein
VGHGHADVVHGGQPAEPHGQPFGAKDGAGGGAPAALPAEVGRGRRLG